MTDVIDPVKGHLSWRGGAPLLVMSASGPRTFVLAVGSGEREPAAIVRSRR